MMQHFKIMYIPGGMSLNRSGWWVCQHYEWRDGTSNFVPLKMIKITG